MASLNRQADFSRAFFANLKTIEAAIGRRQRMREMIARYENNVVNAWRGMRSDRLSDGFIQLAEHNLLQFSIECLMLNSEWRDVFHRNERAESIEALAQVDPAGAWPSRVDEDFLLI